MISFFNTLSGKAEEFIPLDAGKVRMYTCGPTVYDFAHIGNFRTFVFEDLLRRYLEFKGFKVKHVMNLTDVDDKTIAGAIKAGVTLNEYTAQYIEAFRQDLETLNILPAHVQPRATEKIPEMLQMIQKLVDAGVAYVSDGSVYYRVAKFNGYGKLSKKDLSQNREGARVDVDEYEKAEGADFVLWKKAKDGEPSWESPWGSGRPGWHIECSAMSVQELGPTFDIHAGGEDLIFPHHENEIAQSEAATGKPFVKYWLHSRFLLVDGEKMSKSKGNFYTLRDLLKLGHDPMAVRFALLSVHYRQQINFTLEGLKEAKKTLDALRECYYACLSVSQQTDLAARLLRKQEDGDATFLANQLSGCLEDLIASLDADLNTAGAISRLLLGIGSINRHLASNIIGPENVRCVLGFFDKIDAIFGFQIARVREIPAAVLELLAGIVEARAKKDFQTSDQLRSKMKAEGWMVKDGKPGQISTVKPL